MARDLLYLDVPEPQPAPVRPTYQPSYSPVETKGPGVEARTTTVTILIHRRRQVGPYDDAEPLRIKAWTSRIDKALKAIERPPVHKGAKRPVHDPDATSMTPIPGWIAPAYVGPRLSEDCTDCNLDTDY